MKFYQGKKVLITGAAHGFGKAIAMTLAKYDARLILLDIDKEGLEKIEKVPELEGRILHRLTIDISDFREVQKLADKLFNTITSLDILINNAGISHHGLLEESSMEDFEQVIKTNLIGTAAMCKFFLPLLRKSEKGIIANVSSGIAFMGLPSFSAYASGKAGIKTLTQSLRFELKETNIQLSCVYPGPIKTDIAKRAIHIHEENRQREISYLSEKGYDPKHFAKRMLKKLVLGKEEIYLGREVWWGRQFTRLFPKLSAWFLWKFRHKLPV